jgi:hypothetical protein
LQLVRRYRIPAICCALAVLLCELIARPYTTMGICDDGPYILVAKNLAATGHIVYNGWSAAMLVWQLYLAAAFIKLFGFSFTTVRMSTLLVSLLLAFFLQRTLVRSGITERNATIGTVALVLSPLYLMLSVTFMSDIHGLFAIVLCLYGCLRALQSPTTRAAILWLCFAVATNAICGTSRQLAWLGILVMVPSTLWLLRARQRVLFAGAAITLLGVLSILACMHWLKLQPYTTPGTFHVGKLPVVYLVHQFARFFLDIPFLLLPIAIVFVPEIRKSKSRITAIICASLLACVVLAAYPSNLGSKFSFLLEPTLREQGSNWITPYGEYGVLSHGAPHLFLPIWIQAFLALAVLASMLGLILSFVRSGRTMQPVHSVAGLPRKQLIVVLAPFATAYIFVLVVRAISVATDNGGVLFDRYSLGLLPVVLIWLIRHYQDRLRPRLPGAAVFLIAIMAAYGIAVTHNTFAFYRARVEIATELRAAGVPDTSTDNGWEYNIDVELQHARYIDNSAIEVPAHAYVPPLPLPAGTCSMHFSDSTPHIHPLYAVSFTPDACYGLAPFAPMLYSRWPYRTPGILYVVRSTPPTKP